MTTSETCLSDNLIEQAVGLGRAEVMSDVFGPAVDELFYQAYVPVFSVEEDKNIPSFIVLPDTTEFVWGLENILIHRFNNQIANSPEAYQELVNLIEERQDLLFYKRPEETLKDGRRTGIMVPLTVAVDILRIERGDKPKQPSTVLNRPLDYREIVAIMGRSSFDHILKRLTAGPNGFLSGVRNDPRDAFLHDPNVSPGYDNNIADAFFAFKKGYDDQYSLNIWDAYEVKDGRVVDLSEAFIDSAKSKRAEIALRFARVFSTGQGPYRGNNTSGCPFKRRYNGNPESVIIASKNFLIAALELSDQKNVARLEQTKTLPDEEVEPQHYGWLRRLIKTNQ